jgi:hypothetical protein
MASRYPDDDSDLDLGPLISPEELSKIVKKRPLAFDDVGCLAEEAGASASGASASGAAGKKKKTPKAMPEPEPEPAMPLALRAVKRYAVTDADVEVAERELRELAPLVAKKETDGNQTYGENAYPTWRLRKDENTGASLPGNEASSHIRRRDVGLNKLMRVDDPVMKRDGAALVTYKAMQGAINMEVNLSLLGLAEGTWRSWYFLVKSNRETATLDYVRRRLRQLMSTVPAEGGRYRLTPMQRIATALMLEHPADVPVQLEMRQKDPTSTERAVVYRQEQDQPSNFVINNLSVASGKTWETIFATMSRVATPAAWEAACDEFVHQRAKGRVVASGLRQMVPDNCPVRLCRVVIALVPAPMIEHWVATSMQLAATFGEHAWITWQGIAPVRKGTRKVATIKRELPVAVEECEAKKCALFWVLEATTKSTSAATRTGPQFAIPYKIVDEGTGTKHIEPRSYDPESPCMKTIICNATLEQLQKRTNCQRTHPLRVALEGDNLDLTNWNHCALMTMLSVPSWLRLAVAYSLAPVMPQGLLKISMRVHVATLSARINSTDMIISSTDELIKGLVMRIFPSSLDPTERANIEARCRAILHRTDRSESIAASLASAIEQTQKDRKALPKPPKPSIRNQQTNQMEFSANDRRIMNDLERQERALATMERLFKQLHEGIAGDPPPECPVTFEPIPAEHVCLCPQCAMILDHRILSKLGWKCPGCRAKWNEGVVSATQVASVMTEGPPKPEEDEEPDDELTPELNGEGDTDALIRAYQDAGKTKCGSSLDAVVRSIQIAMRYKPKGMRILLCCSVYGNARYTNDQARQEEENTAKTREFILKAVPALDSALTIGRKGSRALHSYQQNDDTNRLLIIDTAHGSTTMAGLDLQNTDLLLFDRLAFGERTVDTPKLVQSIGRIMRAQKRTPWQREADAEYYRIHGKSVHPPKLVVFINNENTSGAPVVNVEDDDVEDMDDFLDYANDPLSPSLTPPGQDGAGPSGSGAGPSSGDNNDDDADFERALVESLAQYEAEHGHAPVSPIRLRSPPASDSD